MNPEDEDPLAEHSAHEEPKPEDNGFIDLGLADRKEIEWVIKDLLPVGLTIIGAPPKEGKSILSMVMAATVAGLKPVALPDDLRIITEEGKVICFSYEADAGELKVMMEDGIHVKIPPDGRILVSTDPWRWRLDEPDSMKELLELFREQEPRVVIMDTFRDMHDFEEKDSGQMVKLLRPIRQWAVEAHASAIMVHHTVKVDEDVETFSAKHLRGSGAIFGKADCVIMMTKRKDGKHFINTVFKRAKGWERTIQMAVHDVLGSGSEALGEREELVLSALASQISVEEIAKAMKIGKQAVVDSCAKLARNGYIQKVGQKWRVTAKEVVR